MRRSVATNSLLTTSSERPRLRRLQASGDPTGQTHRDAQRPLAPQGTVSEESMTLKEAYSVPKHTSAICVQSFDDSLNSAIHITYRISLRSSSLREPRYPLLRVLDRFDSSYKYKVSHNQIQNRRVELFVRKLSNKAETTTSMSSYSVARHTHKTIRKGWYGFTIMILPQVHLRKPCYDFYFL